MRHTLRQPLRFPGPSSTAACWVEIIIHSPLSAQDSKDGAWPPICSVHTLFKKHEGVLLADILGLATLVLLMDAQTVLAAGGTEPALIGPFWRANQLVRPNGARIATEDTAGAPLFVNGRVVSIDGTPIAGARVETWQAAPSGLYENRDSDQEDMNLRAVFETDLHGRFWFQSVRPSGYGVPIDGPCGELLALQSTPNGGGRQEECGTGLQRSRHAEKVK